MPRCGPCTTFADFAELTPAPQHDRDWSSLADLIDSTRSGCDLCTLCWQNIYERHLPKTNTDGPVKLCRSKFNDFYLDLKSTTLGIQYNDEEPTQSLMVRNDGPISQAQQLLSDCLSSHNLCSKRVDAEPDMGSQDGGDKVGVSIKRQCLPRRLLDLSKGSIILVIDVEAWIIKGTSSVAELSQYCTLSYQWGVTTHRCILEAPFADHISFDIKDMPQTFKDAIETTRGLGVCFLWIDALCIVQPSACNDYTDWNSEGPRMGTIYHNATCTIAAICADSVAHGFLARVDSERIRAAPCKVVQHVKNVGTRPTYLKLRPIDFARAVVRQPLNKRGWVTQERLLSRRILHFTVQGVFLECQQARKHGDPTVIKVRGLNSGVSAVHDGDFDEESLKFYWFDLVREYSTTKFTNAEDRLVALSSLASVLRRKFGYDNIYIAGIWKSCLIESLSWFSVGTQDLRTRKRLPIAPTWSWASVDGEVHYQTPWNSKKHTRADIVIPSYVEVLDIRFVLAQPDNLYGNVDKAKIKLRGQLLSVPIWTDRTPSRLVEIEMDKKHEEVSRVVAWDEWQGESSEDRQYTVVPLHFYCSWNIYPGHAALIVESARSLDIVEGDQHIPTYRRIGLLRDIIPRKLQEDLEAEGWRYNFGQAEQDMETLILV